MSLSKPRSVPYSSFQANARSYYAVIIRNYPHFHILRQMEFPFLKNEKILTKSLVARIAGNYSPEAYSRLAEEISSTKSIPSDRVYKNFLDDCNALNETIVFMRRNPEEPEDMELRERYERLTHEIRTCIQTVLMPRLLKLDQYNRELYTPFRFDNFTASISSCTRFEDLSQLFIPYFFVFTCYADKTQRMQVLELAVRKGKELLPTLPPVVFQQFLLRDEQCDCCFWLFLQYYDVAKTMRYNIRYKTISGRYMCTEAFDALLLSVDDKHTELLRALGRKNAMTCRIREGIRKYNFNAAASMLEVLVPEPGAPDSLFWRDVNIPTDMLRRQPLLSYTLYAMDFLFTSDLNLDLQRARTNDILVHMAPLFTLDFECSVALLSGLHPRLGCTRERTKMVRVKEQAAPAVGKKKKRAVYERVVAAKGSPIYLLEEALVKKIWEMVGTHFDVASHFETHHRIGEKANRGGQSSSKVGRREWRMLNNCQ